MQAISLVSGRSTILSCPGSKDRAEKYGLCLDRPRTRIHHTHTHTHLVSLWAVLFFSVLVSPPAPPLPDAP